MTRIVEVLRIAVMGGKFFQVMIPLEDIVEFMNANMVQILCTGVPGLSNTGSFIYMKLSPKSTSKLHTGANKGNGVLLGKCIGVN